MSIEKEAGLLEQFRKKTEAGQVVELAEIKASYEAAVGHRIGNAQIYRVLHQYNWRKMIPRSRHPKKADEEIIATSKNAKNHNLNEVYNRKNAFA